MLAVAAQTLAITAPVFAMLFLGVALKRLRWIDTPFIDTASSLVFRGTMPTLLFLGVFKAPWMRPCSRNYCPTSS